MSAHDDGELSDNRLLSTATQSVESSFANLSCTVSSGA